MTDPTIVGLDWLSVLTTLIGVTYYLKGRIDTMEKQFNKRLDDLVALYNMRIDDLQNQLNNTIYLLNKRLNGFEKHIK